MPFKRFNGRIALVALHDVCMAAVAFELAVWLAYWNYTGAPGPFGRVVEGTLVFAAVCALVFWFVGLYRAIWYYASLSDLLAIARGVTLALLLFLPVLFVVTRLQDFPRLSIPIVWLLLIVLLIVPRLAYRALKDGNLRVVLEREADGRVPVLVVGAGDLADAFIREMARPGASYRPVGIIDQKAERIGREIRAVRVLGAIAELGDVAQRLERQGKRPQRMVVAAADISRDVMAQLLDLSDELGLPLARVPSLSDLRNEAEVGAQRFEVRPVDVTDLLGRSQRVLDRSAMGKLIRGRKVLITGAGGTIGAELSRQVAGYGPARLVLLDNGEFNLYRIDAELAARFPAIERGALLADVRDKARADRVLADTRPDLVFHAAALKHLPIAEANACEAVLTNVLGTLNVVEACAEHGVARMVLISTDKAVEPASVMGMTKRIAELVCRAADRDAGKGGTRCVAVRFGNVLGSSGSVVPLFQEQLAAGGPLTVTDPEATRFFMTTREAVELVLQASAMSEREPGGGLYVLDMGEPVRIADLARQMIRLAGLKPEVDVSLAYTGLRPGEKLHERLVEERETATPTAHRSILGVTGPAPAQAVLGPQVERLCRAAAAGDAPAARQSLQAILGALGTAADAAVIPLRARLTE